MIVGEYFSFWLFLCKFRTKFNKMAIHGLNERIHVLDRVNGSEKFLANELFQSQRVVRHETAEGLMIRVRKKVYDIHRSWVESCHRFVMNCWIRFIRRLLRRWEMCYRLVSREKVLSTEYHRSND